MAKYVALKSMVGEVKEATKSGILNMFDHEVHYEKGDIIFEHLNGYKQLIPKSRIEDGTYIEVELQEKDIPKKMDKIDVQNAYANMNEWLSESIETDTYINGTREIMEQKHKKECDCLMFDTEHYCPHSE